MSVQALLRQRACTNSFLSLSSSSTSRTCRRLYSSQPQLAAYEHPVDADWGRSSSTAVTTLDDDVESELPKSSTKRTKKSTKELSEERRPSRSITDPSRVETFLSSIAASGQEPTIADIERHRPSRYARPGTRQYTDQYNALLDTLSRSFTKNQLQRCLLEYGVKTKGKRHTTKNDFTKAIVEGPWGWPSLEKVEKDRRDRTEVISQRIELSPSELFVTLGRDGETLHQLSSKYKVKVSVKRMPLSLEVKGVRISVQGFSEALKTLRQNIVEDTFQLPTGTPIPAELRQRISRLADAYLENLGGEGLIRICARDQAGLDRAKRFATRAMNEITGVRHVPVVTYLTAQNPAAKNTDSSLAEREYSLYPFESPRPLPWYINAAASFRIKRVAEWLFPPGVFASKEAGLDRGPKIVIANDGTEAKLRDLLFSRGPPADGHNVIVKARLGHLLFGTKSSNGVQPFLGPLRGIHPYNAVREWITTYDAPTFVPSLPCSLADPSPSGQKIIHRLEYRLLDPSNLPSSLQIGPPPSPSHSDESITLEVILAQSKQPLPLLREEEAESSPSPPLPVQARYTRSVDYPLDVLLPDRAMDIRYVVSDTEDLPESGQPSVLREYASKLHTYATDISSSVFEPDPPLSWTADGKTYILHGCYAVRQHVEHSELGTSANSVVSESMLDLDSRQRSMHCEIICTEPSSDTAWSELMKGCEKYALSFYAPSVSSLTLPTSEEPLEI